MIGGFVLFLYFKNDILNMRIGRPADKHLPKCFRIHLLGDAWAAMTDQIELGPMGQGVLNLVVSLDYHAQAALHEQKLKPEIRDEFEKAMEDLKPALTTLAVILNETDFSEAGFEALWRLISCAVTLIDPEANKEGLAAAIKGGMRSKDGRSGGQQSAIVRREKAEEWHQETIEIAKKLRSKNRKLSQVSLAKRLIEHWQDNNITPHAEEQWLIKLIRRWEHEGRLPPANS